MSTVDETGQGSLGENKGELAKFNFIVFVS